MELAHGVTIDIAQGECEAQRGFATHSTAIRRQGKAMCVCMCVVGYFLLYPSHVISAHLFGDAKY